MTGKLYTSNLQGLSNLEIPARKILITRAGPSIQGFVRDRNLAPSQQLFNKYLEDWKDQESPKVWWPLYKSKFHKQFHDEKMLKSLRAIYKMLIAGENVVLICYCADWHYCHRRLVGEFFKRYGINVTELSPVKFEQIWLDI